MSIFLFRRADDHDLRGRLSELERAHNSLARDHEALQAQAQESFALLTLLGVDEWLRDAYDRAKASGWIVDCSPKGILFTRPEGDEHNYMVQIPLPETRTAIDPIRRELLARIICFEQERLVS